MNISKYFWFVCGKKCNKIILSYEDDNILSTRLAAGKHIKGHL